MKKIFLFMAALWMAAAGTVKAEDEMYAVLEQGTIMRLYYDGQMTSRGGKTQWWWDYDETALKAVKKVILDESFKKAKPTSTDGWFYGFQNMDTIENLEYLNTEDVEWMGAMFYGCQKLKSLNLSNFNTKNVQEMSLMFWACQSLQSLDLSSFNTEKVREIKCMFTGCSALSDLDISSFKTPNAINMSEMFRGCTALKELDLRHFDMNKVEYVSRMFEDCKNLEKILYEGDWNKSGTITNSNDLFKNCLKLKGGDGTKYETECASLGYTDLKYALTDGLDGKKGFFSKKTTTGMESVQTSDVRSQKILRDGQLLILRDGKMYNAQGAEVK